MKKTITLIFIGLVSAVLLGACQKPINENNNNLIGNEWRLVYIRKSVPVQGSSITLTFDEGQVSGNAGCNSYFGSYTLEGNQITLGALATTEMACMEPEGVMEQEQTYLAFLSEVVSFSLNDNQLILKKEVQDQLTFEKIAE